jgi:hypothetical protein
VAIQGKRYSFDKPFVFFRLRHAIVFRGGLVPLVLVVWEPDSSTCEYQYHLFELGVEGRLEQLARNSYRCDY